MLQVQFIGATETVTGSKHLVITPEGKQILLDCGLYQGRDPEFDKMNRHLGFDPATIDAVILSHAHIDHSGNIPLLFKQGFRGFVYCTPATYDLCKILLADSAHIHENDVFYINKKREKKGQKPLEPLYDIDDVDACLKQFLPFPLHHKFFVAENLEVTFTDAGHILGSAVTNLVYTQGEKQVKLCYTGDIGRDGDLLLKDPEPFPQADYVICESTYGDRLHEASEEAQELLRQAVQDTCVVKRGKLLIPAFSLGRTQEIVYSLDRMKNRGELPDVKVFVDSPLSTNATDIMRRHMHGLNENVQQYLKKDPDPFGFANLHYIQKVEESMKLNTYDQPCIIISASGMMDAGRIKHHLKHAIDNEKNTLLIVGFCPPSTLGGQLLAGAEEVRIFGKMYPVRAEIRSIESYSAHADKNELIKFLSCQNKRLLKEIFLVHGEPEVKEAFRTELQQQGYTTVSIPAKSQTVQLSWE